MLPDPIQKRALETNVLTGLFRLDPLVTQYFLPFRQELLVKARPLKEIVVLGLPGEGFIV
jgi:hypothetical protein